MHRFGLLHPERLSELTYLYNNVETSAVTKLKLGDAMLHPNMILLSYTFLEQL